MVKNAVNRPKINELLYFGTGEEVQPTFPKWSAHYPGEEIAKRYTQYDPDKANEILDSIGLTEKDGDGFPPADRRQRQQAGLHTGLQQRMDAHE